MKKIAAKDNTNIALHSTTYGAHTHTVHVCRGCGYASTLRGVHAHQTTRFQTLSCRPQA